MFKELSFRIGRREADIQKKYQAKASVDLVLAKVMEQYQPYITTTFKDGSLFIVSKHKTIAQEIVLKARLIHQALKSEHIVCNKIIIK